MITLTWVPSENEDYEGTCECAEAGSYSLTVDPAEYDRKPGENGWTWAIHTIGGRVTMDHAATKAAAKEAATEAVDLLIEVDAAHDYAVLENGQDGRS